MRNPMARVRAIEIENFRCINSLRLLPKPGISCRIGPGHSGKSTILDGLDLCLGARRHVQFTDTDFYELDINNQIKITVTVGELDPELKRLDASRPFPRGYRDATKTIEDEPAFDLEPVLTLTLTVTGDLEPVWALYSDRATADGLV